MRSILLTVFVLFSHLVFAQKDLLGLRGGIDWTNVSTDTPLTGKHNSVNTISGITYQHQFQNGFYFGLEALYSERGFESDVFPENADPCIGCLRIAFPVEREFNFNYLSFPVKAGFTIGNQLSFFADLALVPSVLERANAQTTGLDESISDADQFDLATRIETGVAFELFQGWSGFGSVGFLHSLTPSTVESYFAGNRMYHRNINLSFGVRYALKRS